MVRRWERSASIARSPHILDEFSVVGLTSFTPSRHHPGRFGVIVQPNKVKRQGDRFVNEP